MTNRNVGVGMNTKKKETIIKTLQAVGILSILSILLGICGIVLTMIPCDFNLIKVVLGDGLIFILNVLPIFFVLCFR